MFQIQEGVGTPPSRARVVVVLRRVLNRVTEVRLRMIEERPVHKVPDIAGPATIGISTPGYVENDGSKGDAPRIVRRPEGLGLQQF